MGRVRLTVDVEAELRRRIRVVAASRDETIKDFLERAILRELEESVGRGWTHDEEQEFYPSEGGKPKGIRENVPKLKGGPTMADTVIEDRR